jgi:hypothetical protein
MPVAWGFVLLGEVFDVRVGNFQARVRNFAARVGNSPTRVGNFATRVGNSPTRVGNLVQKSGKKPSQSSQQRFIHIYFLILNTN